MWLINKYNFPDDYLKKTFINKRPLIATRQAKSLQNLLIIGRFDVVPKPVALPKNVGFYNCQDKSCLLQYKNYIKHCKECKFRCKSGRYHFWKCNCYLTVKAEI